MTEGKAQRYGNTAFDVSPGVISCSTAGFALGYGGYGAAGSAQHVEELLPQCRWCYIVHDMGDMGSLLALESWLQLVTKYCHRRHVVLAQEARSTSTGGT